MNQVTIFVSLIWTVPAPYHSHFDELRKLQNCHYYVGLVHSTVSVVIIIVAIRKRKFVVSSINLSINIFVIRINIQRPFRPHWTIWPGLLRKADTLRSWFTAILAFFKHSLLQLFILFWCTFTHLLGKDKSLWLYFVELYPGKSSYIFLLQTQSPSVTPKTPHIFSINDKSTFFSGDVLLCIRRFDKELTDPYK